MGIANRVMTALAVVGLSVFAATVFAEHGGKARGRSRPSPNGGALTPASKHLAGDMGFALFQPPPSDVPWVNVSSHLTLAPKEQAVYQRMADLLAVVHAVPRARSNYFSAYDVESWHGSVEKVEPRVGGGWIVQVRVGAGMAGGQVTPISDYQERYAVDGDDGVAYLESLDPRGWAGKYVGVVCD